MEDDDIFVSNTGEEGWGGGGNPSYATFSIRLVVHLRVYHEILKNSDRMPMLTSF